MSMIFFLVIVPFFLSCILQPFNKKTSVIIGVLVPILFITSIPFFDPKAAGSMFEVLYFIYVPIFSMVTYIFWLVIRYVREVMRR